MRAEPSPGSRTPSWLDSGEIVRHANDMDRCCFSFSLRLPSRFVRRKRTAL
jgi:hypothetical protein